MAATEFRYYLVVKNTPGFLEVYRDARDERLAELIRKRIPNLPANAQLDRPSLSWTHGSTSERAKADLASAAEGAKVNLVVAISARGFSGPLIFDLSVEGDQYPVILNHGANPGAAAADHWCPIAPDATLFGTRAEARRLIGAEALGQPPFSGSGVNLVLIDRGLNQQWIEDRYGVGRFGGGWPYIARAGDPRPTQQPGKASVADAQHGLMLARNIFDIAPDAVLWDLPVLPPRIFDIQIFLDEAEAAFSLMLPDIYNRGGTWILVNAWAIYDRRSETPLGDYTENNHPMLHPFTAQIDDAINHGLDVIFCAGNCGEFCPSERCGPLDQGPGRSIWGANSYYRVLTVSAVRTDAIWIGYSSQGPGQPRLGRPPGNTVNFKPDLCAPSGFCEDFDAHTLNAGTSAATGVAAGVAAALRSNWNSGAVTPDRLLQVLNMTAQQPGPAGWNQRFGNGIIDVGAIIPALP
jgi:hypothetical protein